ncbi:cdc25-like protein phosphatase twine-related [Anaeramoeba flamelloides]|uniref:protein-tyrosine-phosphatase n=1 Tax=Anaeramoeba flamelloides TaxID=1746091 RepID=A0ABQ8Z7W4_9EUKA|nr:cdc25-like protein phosphatase twine-related [Anaeramoeba flamelloides]
MNLSRNFSLFEKRIRKTQQPQKQKTLPLRSNCDLEQDENFLNDPLQDQIYNCFDQEYSGMGKTKEKTNKMIQSFKNHHSSNWLQCGVSPNQMMEEQEEEDESETEYEQEFDQFNGRVSLTPNKINNMESLFSPFNTPLETEEFDIIEEEEMKGITTTEEEEEEEEEEQEEISCKVDFEQEAEEEDEEPKHNSNIFRLKNNYLSTSLKSPEESKVINKHHLLKSPSVGDIDKLSPTQILMNRKCKYGKKLKNKKHTRSNINRGMSFTEQQFGFASKNIEQSLTQFLNENHSPKENSPKFKIRSNNQMNHFQRRMPRCNSVCLSKSINILNQKAFNETKPILPTTHGKPFDLNTISSETMCDLLNGKYKSSFDHVIVIDCRFNFEFEGGHIKGAHNWNVPKVIFPKLFCEGIKKKACLVFHCEFSQNRGPAMCRLIRKTDRQINQYPNLYYPQCYVLEGGYRKFFNCCEKTKTFCYPESYQEMKDKKFRKQLGSSTKNRKKDLRDHKNKNILTLNDIINWYSDDINHKNIQNKKNILKPISNNTQKHHQLQQQTHKNQFSKLKNKSIFNNSKSRARSRSGMNFKFRNRVINHN